MARWIMLRVGFASRRTHSLGAFFPISVRQACFCHRRRVLNAWRLARWAGGATWAEPLLFILHVGYAWMVVGVALLGLSILVPAFRSLRRSTR